MTQQANHKATIKPANWQPTANAQAIQARAKLLSAIRQFFAQRNVLEVDTPILSAHATTDPYINSIQSTDGYLQTSPEFAMKRLLCAGVGSIYQIAKAFRQQESGRFHNPEFTMLEWYRVDFTHIELMREVDQFLSSMLDTGPAQVISYQQLFIQQVGLDPLACSDSELCAYIDEKQLLLGRADALTRDDQLNLLFSHVIEPNLGQNVPVLVHGFPSSQSALARINEKDQRIADRFEAYYKGIELANGFYELADAQEQLTRFNSDNQARIAKGLDLMPMDVNLIAALDSGLPECAGVALGIDRLLMLKLGADHINEVLCFPTNKA